MSLVCQLARDARDVVIAHERERQAMLDELPVALEGVRELEEVLVVDRAPGRFPQLVLRDRVEAAVFDVLHVVAVDDLTHEPGRRMLATYFGQDALPEV